MWQYSTTLKILNTCFEEKNVLDEQGEIFFGAKFQIRILVEVAQIVQKCFFAQINNSLIKSNYYSIETLFIKV